LATIRDVARAANVSIATVSRALNGSARLSEDARRRVSKAAAELDYWPNGAARSLTTRRTHALGVLLPDLYGEFFSEVIRGIDHAARQERLQVLISSSHANTDEVVSAARSMRGRVDGLIVMAPDETAEAMDRIAQRFPVVVLNPGFEVERCCTVSVANFAGAYALVEHLLRLGHRRVAVIKGPPRNVDAQERFRGYEKALVDAGVHPTSTLEIPGDFTELSGYRAVQDLIRIVPRPSAVFAANDCMAVGLLSALSAAGIKVPQEMAVAGFDDIAIARYLSPPLTTVHVDAYELGARAVRLLISNKQSLDPALCSHEIVPSHLVVRQSCGSQALLEERISEPAMAGAPKEGGVDGFSSP
jgi:LacI family transcriptional regulator